MPIAKNWRNNGHFEQRSFGITVILIATRKRTEVNRFGQSRFSLVKVCQTNFHMSIFTFYLTSKDML